MKIANNLLLSVLINLSIQCLAQSALAVDNYKTFRRDFWEFEASTQFYKTEANYTSKFGSFSKLSNGNYFQQLDLNFGSRWVFDKDFAVFGYLGVGNAESKTSGTVRSNSALSNGMIGMEYLVYSDFIQIIPELSVVIPLETYTATGDTVMNNEGVFELRPAITVQSDFAGSFIWYTKGGFTYRDQGRSFLLPWHVGLEMKLPSSRIGGRVFGYQSLTDDKDTSNQSARLSATDTVNGGSLNWYAINPSKISTEAYFRFRVTDGWVGQVSGGLDLTGARSSAGYFVGAFLRYAIDTSNWYREKPVEYVETPVTRPKGDSQMYKEKPAPPPQFKENTDDGVDQKIFRIKPVTPEPATGELQKELQDAEMKVKLRTNKSKKKKK